MQGTNKKCWKLSKKPKLMTDEGAAAEVNTDENFNYDTFHERPVVDKTSTCEPVGDDRATEPAVLGTNNPTATEPNIMESQDPLGEREENDGLIAGSVLAGPVDGGGGIPSSDLSVITHADGFAILDEYFPKSATGLGPLGGVLVPEPPTSPARVVLPGCPSVVQTPSASLDVEVPKEPGNTLS
jgi:hypothetical protein